MKKNKMYLIVLSIVVFSLIILLFGINNIKICEVKGEKLKPKIVLLAHVYQNPYWSYVRKGAEYAAKERGAVIEYNGPQAASVKSGIKLIDMAIASNVSGIITYVQDEKEYTPYINKAISKEIPVITVDSDAKGSNRLAYIGTDNIRAGEKAAEELIDNIGQNGKVAIIMGGKEVKNQIERVKGFIDYLKQHSDIEVTTIESSGSYTLEAELATKKILKSNKTPNALFCSSALDGVGAAKAITDLNMAGKITVICFDDLPETVENIKKGIVHATIVQRPYEMGCRSVNMIMDKLQGKKLQKDYLTNVSVLNKSNIYNYSRYEGEQNSEQK
ncbi:ribose transport system substrate-binding protein [Clostridium tetanomorphum]|uniref:Sugar ABC transporter substrate-binding protein n=1 Tax=Clostridium tetanomorphum TaxID=1553 RepID=A0A923EBZ3_CLOTT|nr:sugar-binding protein [Clostridium tetanomorphum]KAJ49171.1 periplasmic binding protein/LacI transcriptional regulator [Clostridium tetanomorphum DSM 665]KAJ52920.1 periplasmic binding protein/LacI transcriptional regulator [Clostridium tetanomorphum DSM 665]MBC2398174.1 sugar ABC transporter substrate-binding protein [Clostridium tetanomorphum]MBP1864860.1 ribose transport system substrate-binding protein [Clostridium tetanomorphum]NRS83066.1 ribose transport system substrate-binding prote